jgi:hypothetical protein
MKRLGCIIFLMIFFNAFIVRAYEPPPPSPPPKIGKINMPPDYTIEIFMIGTVITVFYLCWIGRREKPLESQTQEKSFSKSANFVSCVQFNISSPAAQRKKYVTPSFKAGIRF